MEITSYCQIDHSQGRNSARQRPLNTIKEHARVRASESSNACILPCRKPSISTGREHFRIVSIALVTLGFALVAFGSRFAQASTGFAPFVDEAVPWSVDDLVDPSAVTAAFPYVPDPGFHGGNYLVNTFGT